MSRARAHVRNVQWALRFDERAYRDYAWQVREALCGWENEKRVRAWRERRVW